jgi:hypothetical protein
MKLQWTNFCFECSQNQRCSVHSVSFFCVIFSIFHSTLRFFSAIFNFFFASSPRCLASSAPFFSGVLQLILVSARSLFASSSPHFRFLFASCAWFFAFEPSYSDLWSCVTGNFTSTSFNNWIFVWN